jgi:hypothetical protein
VSTSRGEVQFNLSFAGVPFVLFGLAVAYAGTYPRWLGWVAFFAGIGSILAGLSRPLPASRRWRRWS